MSTIEHELVVRRNDERSRYEAFADSELVGFADFAESAGAVALPHVEVDPRFEGRGYAGQLTRATLDDLRTRGVTRVLAQCPYVRTWIAKHPGYQDLVQS